MECVHHENFDEDVHCYLSIYFFYFIQNGMKWSGANSEGGLNSRRWSISMVER